MAREMRFFLRTMWAMAAATLLCSSIVSCIRFDIDASDSKCFSEELNLKGVVLAKYHVISDTTPKISARVSAFSSTYEHTNNVCSNIMKAI